MNEIELLKFMKIDVCTETDTRVQSVSMFSEQPRVYRHQCYFSWEIIFDLLFFCLYIFPVFILNLVYFVVLLSFLFIFVVLKYLHIHFSFSYNSTSNTKKQMKTKLAEIKYKLLYYIFINNILSSFNNFVVLVIFIISTYLFY